MKIQVLEDKATVYSARSSTSEVVGELHAGDEITVGRRGYWWIEVTLPSGKTGYVSGKIKIFQICDVSLNQKSVSVVASPAASSKIKMTYKKGDKFTLAGLVTQDGTQWVKIRSDSGEVGFIPGATKTRLVISTFSGEGAETPMFKDTDYLPFMLGVFLIGGLVGIPIAYGLISGLGYFKSLPWSLVSCIVLLIGFRRSGSISWGRAVPAFIGGAMVVNAYNLITGKPAFVAGGFLGFLLSAGCGYIGIGIGRIFKK